MLASAASRSRPASACRCAASARPHCRRLESRPKGSSEPCRTGTSARPTVQATCGDTPPRGHRVTLGCRWVSPRQGCGLPAPGTRGLMGPCAGTQSPGQGMLAATPSHTWPKERGCRKGGGGFGRHARVSASPVPRPYLAELGPVSPGPADDGADAQGHGQPRGCAA